MKKFTFLEDQKKVYELIFIVFTLTAFFIWISMIFIQGEGSNQFSLFFLNLKDFFADTLNVVGYSSGRDVYHNTMYTGLQEKAYLPLTYVMMFFFSRLMNMEHYYDNNYFMDMYQDPKFLIIYFIYATIGIVMLYEIVRTLKNGSNTMKIWTSAAVCVSAPVLFSYERANTIILTVFCLLFYVFNYDNEKKVMKEIALICLAIAAAFKITPAIFGIFLLYDKKWKEAIRTVIYGIIIGIGPFLFFEGGFSNITQMLHNIGLNVSNYTSASGCTLYASILNLGVQASKSLQTVMSDITVVICLFLLASALFYKKRWEVIMAVSIVLVILPSHSGKYCIIYMLPALISFLNENEHGKEDIIVLLSYLMIVCDIQNPFVQKYLGYQMAILIITLFLVVKGVIVIWCKIKEFRMTRQLNSEMIESEQE